MTDDELLQVIEQAAQDGVTKLNLFNKGLTSLPPEIGQLTRLTSLKLSFNQLSTLPPEIGQLTSLTSLNLSNNQLSTLPPEIVQLTNLTSLNLSGNQLSTLPPEIVQLTNLTSLNLSGNQLSTLPPEIVQLTSLTSLNLSFNKLSRLPPEIVQLTSLASLDLTDNELSSLPPEIGQLTNLTLLSFTGNQLSSLPPEIGQLTNLISLDLMGNQLSSLPPEIGQLTNLTSLDLRVNQLTHLPKEIVQLSKLKTLSLRYNQLKELPLQIGQLNLTTASFSDNPLTSLSPEIRKKSAKEILNFYRQQLEGIDRLYEAKLLIIGEGGAGKTTLAKKIQNSDYQLQPDQDSTQGIEVMQWQFPLDNGKPFRINIWDFGGQEIYHATHQFFLTKRSLYILVADTRKEDTDFYYWLHVVELLTGNSPLLIVKNEKQERQREINDRQLRGEFTNLKEILAANLATDRGLPEILTQIKHHISTLPHVGTELPKTWVKVREALEQDDRNHISLEEYLQICERHGFTRREDKLQLSGYLHDLGVCLHFQDDDVLIRTVILRPTWGTDAVYKVLDEDKVEKAQGRFNRSDLATIWQEDQYATMRLELLRLMMNFKLCYEIPGRPGNYVAPQLLSSNRPEYTWDESENLLLRYEYEFMPKGILTRFIVEMHTWIESQTCVWKSGVVLSKDDARAEVMELYRYHKGEIRIRVSGKRPRDLLTNLRHELGKIHDSYKRLKYSTLVPCNCATCKTSQPPHFYPLERLHKFIDDKQNQIQCQISYQMVNVRGLVDDIAPGESRSTDAERRRSAKQDALESPLELSNQKLKRLRLALVQEAGSTQKFQLEQQIKAEEAHLKRLEWDLDNLDDG